MKNRRNGPIHCQKYGVQYFLSSQAHVREPSGGESLFAQVEAPDQELWSKQRVIDYQESLIVEADLPAAVLTIAKLNINVRDSGVKASNGCQ